MKKYRCYGIVTGIKYLGEVEASSKEEAEEKVSDLDSAYISLCHQCRNQCEDAEISQIDVEEVTE